MKHVKKDGKLVWLEEGGVNLNTGKSSGWWHIDKEVRKGGLTRSQEIIKSGIANSSPDVQNLIINTIENGEKVTGGYSKIYTTSNGTQRKLKVGVGSNGYITTLTFTK